MSLTERDWFRRALMASAALWLVFGAGFLAYWASLPAPLPTSLFSKTVLVKPDGALTAWESGSGDVRFEQDRITREVRSFQPFIESLGGLQSRLHFQLNFQDVHKSVVSARRIEVGSSVARAENQVSHAILRAWVLQNASAVFSIPALRREVIADVLLAMSAGGLDLAAPGSGQSLSYRTNDESAMFFEDIATLASVCRSKWRPTSLIKLCENVPHSNVAVVSSTSSFSLRQPLGEIIWQVFSSLNFLERVEFMRYWIAYLRAGVPVERIDVLQLAPESSSLWLWQAWAREELESLLPSDPARMGLSGSLAANVQRVREKAMKRVFLTEHAELVLDVAARFDSSTNAENFSKTVFARTDVLALMAAKTAIVSYDGQFYLLPGGIRLADTDLSRIRTRTMIWDSCKPPSIRDILQYPLLGERVLVAQHCDEGGTAYYRSFIRYGVEGFALDNPNRPYVLVHRPSLEFASEKQWAGSGDLFAGLLDDGRAKADRRLGLETARWDGYLKSFRVQAAVDAVEWFRPTRRKENIVNGEAP